MSTAAALAAEFREFARLVSLANDMRHFQTLGSADSAVMVTAVTIRSWLDGLSDHPELLDYMTGEVRDEVARLRFKLASRACVEAGSYVTHWPGRSS